MAESEENKGSIPPLDEDDGGMTEEQHDRQTNQPGPGQPVEESPEGDTPTPGESAPHISDEDQGTGESH